MALKVNPNQFGKHEVDYMATKNQYVIDTWYECWMIDGKTCGLTSIFILIAFIYIRRYK